MKISSCPLVKLALLVASVASPSTGRSQMLETETARLLRKGQAKVEMSYEFQTSSEGTESAFPVAIEYGLSTRFEIMVEPVPYAAIRPKDTRSATGIGDLEATLTYLVRAESPGKPALALAAEMKVPTAKNDLIGTGKADYAVSLIGSKRNGRFQVHANVSYTLVGSPPGADLKNMLGGAVAAEFFSTPSLEFFAEALGNTASAPEGEGGDTENSDVLVPEAAGGEAIASVGVAYRPGSRGRFSLGVSYDNTRSLQLRPTVAIWFR